MARRILIFLIFLFSFLMAFDYEVIKNYEDDHNIVTIYLDNKEVLSLLGEDTKAFKKAYSFISKLLVYSNLRYDPNDFSSIKLNDGGESLTWENQGIINLSKLEKKINENRGNKVDEIKSFLVSVSKYKKPSMVSLPYKLKNKVAINKVFQMSLNISPGDDCFPAVHPYLPVGTKVRIVNIKKDWSIVVQVVKNEDMGLSGTIGLNKNAIEALGVKDIEDYRIRTQLL